MLNMALSTSETNSPTNTKFLLMQCVGPLGSVVRVLEFLALYISTISEIFCFSEYIFHTVSLALDKNHL
jgi:hypothetical protein